jgi:hypothetical protein
MGDFSESVKINHLVCANSFESPLDIEIDPMFNFRLGTGFPNFESDSNPLFKIVAIPNCTCSQAWGACAVGQTHCTEFSGAASQFCGVNFWVNITCEKGMS